MAYEMREGSGSLFKNDKDGNEKRPDYRGDALINGEVLEIAAWIKEGKNAIKWTRLSCCAFAANAVRLQLHALAYTLANFMRTLALPEAVAQWSLTTLREKLIKIGAKVVRHARYAVFQMAEVAVSKQLFEDILRLIAGLRPGPPPA